MADKRFFVNSGPFTLAELASASGARIADSAHANLEIKDVAPLETAEAGHISFLDNNKYIAAFEKTNAAACILREKFAARAPKGMALLISDNPYHVYALVASMFYPAYRPQESIIHPTAAVDKSAHIGEKCEIGAHVVIGRNCKIGNNCHIHAGAHIGDGVEIGDECTLHAGVNISHSLVGNRVTIHHGAAIGQDGFGFATSLEGKHERVPQLGCVVIEDDVNIGANTTVDRGSGPNTIIGQGTQIDNLVQIGHNVVLGRGCVVVAQVGIAGSTKVGDFVAFGGQAGINGHLNIGSGAQIGAQSGVMRDVPPGETLLGAPAIPAKQFHRQVLAVQNLAKAALKETNPKEGKGTDDAA